MQSSSSQTNRLHQQRVLCGTTSTVTGDLLPTGAYNIGSASNKFNELHVKSLFVDPATIYIGESTISAVGKAILLNKINVVDAVSRLNDALSGETGQMLVSNGATLPSWAPATGGTGPTGPIGAGSISAILALDPDAGQHSITNLASVSVLASGTTTTIGPSGLQTSRSEFGVGFVIDTYLLQVTPSSLVQSTTIDGVPSSFTLNGSGATITQGGFTGTLTSSAFRVESSTHSATLSTTGLVLAASTDQVSITPTQISFTTSSDSLVVSMDAGALSLASTGLLSDMSGGPSGKYLRLQINGEFYKIQLFNDTGFTLTYDKNAVGATGSQYAYSGYDSGSLATVLDQGSMQYPSFVFDGWNTVAGGNGVSYAPGAAFAISTNTTLYAQWLPVFTVTYDKNAAGATGSQATVSSYNAGSLATVLNQGTLLYSSFAFAGWNTAANGTGVSYEPGASFVISTNSLLYAQWAPVFKVTYDKNSADARGSPSADSNSYTANALVTVLGFGSMYGSQGNAFYWNTAANATGVSYIPGDTFAISANTTLYAQWVAAPFFTVTYDKNSANATGSQVDLNLYMNGTLAPVLGVGSMQHTLNILSYWTTQSDGSGVHYLPGSTFIISENTTLFAQWIVFSSPY